VPCSGGSLIIVARRHDGQRSEGMMEQRDGRARSSHLISSPLSVIVAGRSSGRLADGADGAQLIGDRSGSYLHLPPLSSNSDAAGHVQQDDRVEHALHALASAAAARRWSSSPQMDFGAAPPASSSWSCSRSSACLIPIKRVKLSQQWPWTRVRRQSRATGTHKSR